MKMSDRNHFLPDAQGAALMIAQAVLRLQREGVSAGVDLLDSALASLGEPRVRSYVGTKGANGWVVQVFQDHQTKTYEWRAENIGLPNKCNHMAWNVDFETADEAFEDAQAQLRIEFRR